MVEFDPAAHSRRARDLAALETELLDPVMAVEKLKAEWTDSNLAGDRPLASRTSEEAERLQAHAGLMARLWWLMAEAERARSEALSSSTAAEMARTIRDEHRRRSGVVPRRPRKRATINLESPESAAKTILSKTDSSYVAALISALRGGSDHAGDGTQTHDAKTGP